MSTYAAKSREKKRDAAAAPTPDRARVSASNEHSLLKLQQAAGNQAVNVLLSGSSGRPLDPETRAEMESRFGQPFEDVRVHSGGAAEGAAEALGANAWTAGRDVVFGEGRYSPRTSGGKELLAHELAHVVQQRRAGAAPPTFESASAVEHDAESAAAQFNAGAGTISVNAASGPGVARQEKEEPWWKKRLNPIYQRALEVLPKESADKLEQANTVVKALVKDAGVSDAGLNQAVQAAEPILTPVGNALGVKNESPAPTPSASDAPAAAAKSNAPAPSSNSGWGPVLGAVLPPLIPGGGGLGGPPGPPGGFDIPSTPTPYSPIPGGQGFGDFVRSVPVKTAADAAASTAARSGPSLLTRLLTVAPRAGAVGGVATAGFLAGFFGPYLIGKAIEHADELQQQSDPDERETVIAGAPPPVPTEGVSSSDALDAGAGEIQQAPAQETPPPALDPNAGETAKLPSNQDQAPAVDPGAKDVAQLPGQSTEELEAARRRRISEETPRPTLRDSTILQVWQNAQRRGVVKDPASGEKLEPPYYDKDGKLVYNWHMGHLEDHEWWRLRKMYEAGLLTWDQVIEQYNDPSHYHPEDPGENVSHENESKGEWKLPDGTVIRPGSTRGRRRPTRGRPVRRKR